MSTRQIMNTRVRTLTNCSLISGYEVELNWNGGYIMQQ
jgi:hypothetical protein